MSHFQFESAIEDCLEKFSAPLAKVTTPRWQRKRNRSTSVVPLSPYNGNRSFKTPCKTPQRKIKTPLKTPKSKKTPYKTPSKTTPRVDRFIPNRTTMDNDKSYFQIVNEIDTDVQENKLSPEALEKAHYEKAVKDNLDEECDSRILHFKQRAPPACDGYQNNLRVVYCKNRGSSKAKSSRYISKAPDKILDAPGLLNDFYLNLVDWGSNNSIAIALGGGVYIWNYETLATKHLVEMPNCNDYVSSVSWVKDGNVLAIGSTDTCIQLWDVETEKCLRTMTGHGTRVSSLAWNSFILSSGERCGKIINHDVRIREHMVSTLNEHTQDVCGLAWSLDGRMLASGGNDNLLNIWSPHTREVPLQSFTHHQAAVKAVSWCPWQNNVLASGGGTADRYLRFWNVTTGSCLNSVDTKSQISSILWSKHYKELITGHGFSMNQLTIWKYPSMNRIADLVDHTERILCMCMSPNGELVASAGADETLRIWKCFDRSQLKKKSTACGNVKKTSSTNLNMINKIR